MSKILIVEDDRNILELLGLALSRAESHEVVKIAQATEALGAWRREHPDLVVLDANLPDGDGFEICRAAREEGLKTPVIMLTARTRDEDITQGFAVGADDYVTKPFNATLLLARIGSVLRRTGPVAPESLALEELQVGAVTLEPQSQEFVHRNRRAKLTPTEFRLLHFLLSNRNKVLKSDTIVERVWGRDGAAAESGSLKSHVRHLREKVEVNPSLPELIVTVPGVGYMARVAE